MNIFNMFNRAPEEGAESAAEVLDPSATALKIKWTELYEKRNGLNPEDPEWGNITNELKGIESELSELKKDGKVPNMDEVRGAAEEAEGRKQNKEELDRLIKELDPENPWNTPGATGGDTRKDMGQSEEGKYFRS